MLIEQWHEIEKLYHAARERSAEERAGFLEKACGGDHTLRREVESLLANEDLASAFLEPQSLAAGDERIARGEHVGPYAVAELLGAGGMGEVYKAHDTRLDRDVAIKFLPRDVADDPAALERFQREARAASALNHPNICTIHDIGEFQGRPYLVMELLEGRSLRDHIGHRPVAVPALREMVRQVSSALEAAHAKGIVHRDIKPANIFVTASGQVKILDFGLAKLGAEPASIVTTVTSPAPRRPHSLRLTTPGSVMGTIAYMSPEQARGEDVDARTDIFSLGVVIHEMATGQLAFQRDTAAKTISAILNDPPTRPSTINPAVPGKLDHIVLKALEKDRTARYQTVAILSGDVEQWRRSEERAATMKTRRWVLATAGAGAVSLAGGAFLARRSLFPTERRIMVAVLPFENIGGNPQEAFFADGLHQDMISVINRLYPDRVGVIAGTSVKRYKAGNASIDQIAKELNVDYVVEGGVQRDGPQAHITARLIRVKDQTPIWNATYDRDLSQVVVAQSQIAQAIAQGMERGLRPDARVSAALAKPLNAAAHEAYLRGDYEKAVQIDPNYAAAYAGLADKFYIPGLFGFLPPRQAFTGVMNAASKAIELDPTLAGAYASLAMSKLHQQWNWTEAEQGFRRALRLDPANAGVRHGLAHYLLWVDRLEDSVAECDRAVELDPFDADLIACKGWHALYANEYDKALETTRLALTYQPNHGWALMIMGWAYEQKRMFPEALASLRNAFNSTLKTASIGHVFAASGNRAAAENALQELLAESKKKYVSAYDVAVMYAGLDDKQQAYEWLNKAYDEHSGFMVYMNADPRLMALRPEPQFKDLARRMGLRGRSA